MIVCPQCQSENPDDYKFCQNCGVSLTETICSACQAAVPLDVQQCPDCGNEVGTTWKAIVISPSNSSQLLATGDFLDDQKRYQLLESLSVVAHSNTDSAEAEARVLDCNPYHLSPLEILLSYEANQPADETTDVHEPLPIAPEIVTLPAIAHQYLALQEQIYPSFPQIHDAWEKDGQVVLLLEDRSHLPELLDLWRDGTILPLQIVHWLHEMAELWRDLQTERCCQSLLELDNLRVDEDQLLCLQRLYLDPPDQPADLRTLGHIWQHLFQQSQRTQLGSVACLCAELDAGAISSIDELQERLEAIANESQPDPHTALHPYSSMMPEPTPPLDPLPSPSESASVSRESSPAMDTAPSPMTAPPEPLGRSPGGADMSMANAPTRLEIGEPDEEPANENDDTPTIVLPMKLISLEDAGRTDIGRQRDHNEDYYSIQTDMKKVESPNGRTLNGRGLYILCDGMGGHAGGEVASALAVDTLRKFFAETWKDQLPGESQIRAAIQKANKAIFDLNQQNARSGSGRMGTTVVLVLIQDTEAAIAHVGDSRLYRFSRRRGLEQLTVDHEVGQREIQRGVEPAIAYARPDAFQLTQALGPRDENFINPDVTFLELNEDMLLLLCSDGLTDNDLLETHWRTHIDPLLNSQTNLEQGASQLIELANQYNGHDNISVVMVRTKVRPNLDHLAP